jgi:hypothetical protein
MPIRIFLHYSFRCERGRVPHCRVFDERPKSPVIRWQVDDAPPEAQCIEGIGAGAEQSEGQRIQDRYCEKPRIRHAEAPRTCELDCHHQERDNRRKKSNDKGYRQQEETGESRNCQDFTPSVTVEEHCGCDG